MKLSKWEFSQTLDQMVQDGVVEVIFRDPQDSENDRYRLTPFGQWIHQQRMTDFVNLPKERRREIRKQFESGYK